MGQGHQSWAAHGLSARMAGKCVHPAPPRAGLLTASQHGWQGSVSILLRQPLPFRFLLQAAIMLKATEVAICGEDASGIRWIPPGDRRIAHYA